MRFLFSIALFLCCACQTPKQAEIPSGSLQQFMVVLGIAQDGGYPHPHCDRTCCEAVAQGKTPGKRVSCLGIVDRETQEVFMIDATPDFPGQERLLRSYLRNPSTSVAGIFLTHAHIGHYTGLMYLGREAMGAKSIPVYVLPKMQSFLENNGPWSQLVGLKNIEIRPLTADSTVVATKNISIKPFLVPHRDEFSETAGFIISGKNRRVLFIPDIDKWAKWPRDVREAVKNVDVALLDGTFYQNGEIPNRDIREIPHPFIEETVALFKNAPEKSKIRFIHFNHTNPVMRAGKERADVLKQGFGVCEEEEIIGL